MSKYSGSKPVVYNSDTFYLPDDGYYVYGDTWGTLANSDVGGKDTFNGASGTDAYTAIGDAYLMTNSSHGGNDEFYGGSDVGWDVPLGPTNTNQPESFICLPLFLFGLGEGDPMVFAGDAEYMTGTSIGGRDYLWVDAGSRAVLIGDGEYMTGSALGGADTITGSGAVDGYSGAANLMMGDGYAFGSAQDVLSNEGFNASDSSVHGGNDALYGGGSYASGYDSYALADNIMVGDAFIMTGHGVGGADYVTGQEGHGVGDLSEGDVINLMAGDAFIAVGYSAGGSDNMHGSTSYAESAGDGYAFNMMAGDAVVMAEHASGGSDTLFGGTAYIYGDGYSSTLNIMSGDTFLLDSSGAVAFGRDTLYGGDGTDVNAIAVNFMAGDVINPDDAFFFFDVTPLPGAPVVGQATTSQSLAAQQLLQSLSDFTASLPQHSHVAQQYGNDQITGGGGYAINGMLGDAEELYRGDVGGNDTLRGGTYALSFNSMFGDGWWIDSGARGGNDTLISGQGTDWMWGDAFGNYGVGGADTFVFTQNGGNDIIFDFNGHQGDKINLHAFAGTSYDFKNFNTLMHSGRVQDGYNSEVSADGVYIYLDGSTSVFIVGAEVSQLYSTNFIF